MQTLGLTDSDSRTEGRLKSLFWPFIKTGNDVDYLGTQGFWVCTFVAILSFVVSAFSGHEILGTVVLLVFFLGGVGVREHSRCAAAVVFTLYLLDTISAPSALRVAIAAVLFSNLRATWIASTWNPESSEAVPPPRLAKTWSDKFSDTLPAWLWPNIRIPFYVLSIAFLLLDVLGVVMLFRHRA